MRSIRATIFALIVMTLAPACIVTGRATVRTRQPSMVLINDGVYVVEDHNEPVFYSDGGYWRYYGGVWYSSSSYSGGWVRVRTVPGRVRGIHNPQTYVRYRASGSVERQKVRDHRGGNSGRQKVNKPKKRPKVRDHR